MTVSVDTTLDPALEGLPIRVTVQRDASAGKVLAVPASAVSARPDGATVVTFRRPGGTLRTVPVGVGTVGDGYVEIRPGADGPREGDDVVVGR